MHVSSTSSKIQNKKRYALTHAHTYTDVPRMNENVQFLKNQFTTNFGCEISTGLTFVKCHRPTNNHADSVIKDS